VEEICGGGPIKLSLTNLVRNNVALAFNLIGDLKTPITVVVKSTEAFNFGNGYATYTEVSYPTHAFIEEISNPDRKVDSRKLLLNKEGLPTITVNDSVLISNVRWGIAKEPSHNNFTIELEVFREGNG
jgi:hypothetical protein